MDLYHLTLFVHIGAVLAAAAASSLAMFSGGRYARSATHADAHAWLHFNSKVARTFPIALVVLLLSGAYMITSSGGAYWSTGWVRVGVVGLLVIFAIGGFLGARHKTLERRLDAMTDAQKHAHPFRAPADPLMAILPWVNMSIALGIVLIMTIKPTLASAATIALVFAMLGLANGYRMIAKAKAMARAAMPAAE
jgi:hypothetical protein